VRELSPGDELDCVLHVREASLVPTKDGRLYVRAVLADRTGTIRANKWDADEGALAVFGAGSYVRVRGTAESYKGQVQLRIEQVRAASSSEVNPADFQVTTERDIGELTRELKRLVRSVKRAELAALLESFFADQDFVERFSRSPAANQYHHAYLGGLLEHSVSVAIAAEAVAASNDRLDRDLLVAGALLHDIGKVEELSAEVGFEKTDAGYLVGHVALGALMLDERMRRLEGFPAQLRLELLHLVLSHHGAREYGSPVLPATAEALALHHLDNLDAKVQAADAAARSPAPEGSHWSDYVKMLDARVYRARTPREGQK